MFIGLFLCVMGILASGWGLLYEEGLLSIILIIVGVVLLILGMLAMYGSKINKKSSLLIDPAKVSSEPSEQKKKRSAMGFGWSTYAIGVIAIGYWVFKSYSVGSSLVALAIIIFILWAVFGARIMSQIPRVEKLKYSPEKSEVVKVISKVFKVSGSYSHTRTNYFFSFEFPDGTRKNFPVDVKQYNSVAENETGTLIYKEHKNDLMFIDFKPNK